MKERIKYNYRSTPQGYQAYIQIWFGKALLYTQHSDIFRVDGLDAYYDAKIMKKELIEENGGK